MTLVTGTVLEGITKNAIASINDVYRGDVLLPDGRIERAFIKDLDPRQLGNELLVAALAMALGLPVPEPVIGIVSPAVSVDFKQIKHNASGGFVVFCSVDANGSNISQIVNQGASNEVLKYVKKSPFMGQMYGLDTWVANVDRHAGNLILKGDGSVVLIDHGYCFTGPTWTAADLVGHAEYGNRLATWLTPKLSQHDKDSAMADIMGLTEIMSATDVQEIVDSFELSGFFGTSDCDAVVGFLESRTAHVLALSAKSLGTI